MNKKAIAAFAAGATLLAGFAMATPAMAAETPKCTPVAADKLAGLKQAVTEAKRKADKAERTLADEKDKYAEDTEAYNTAKGLVDAFKQAVKNYKEAKKAADEAKADADNKGALTDAAKKDAKAVNVAAANAKKNEKLKTATFTDIAVDGTADAPADTTFDTVLGVAPTKHEIYEAEVSLREANGDLQDAKDALAKAQCTPAPAPQPGPQNPPVTPAQPGSKTEAIKNVLAKKVDVDAAEHNFAEKKEAYTKAATTLAAAKAELDAAQHDKAVAEQALSDFEASGVNDSAKLQSLKEAVARAEAHVVRTTNAFNKALVDFNDAKTADLAAQAAYKAAKDAYDEAYNAAIKLGVNPALLPSVTAVDPLSPAFPQLAQAQKIYADALAGKFGAAAQKAVQKAEAKAQAAAPAAAAGKAGAAAGKAAAKGELATKGGNGHKAGEKLGNAGVGVALTALAASMLAGMGAAVRKMRH